jgi:hypothetical protein
VNPPIPTYLDGLNPFFRIDSSTGVITVATIATLGTYKLRVLGVILATRQFFSEIFTFTGRGPFYFSPALVDIQAPHNLPINSIPIPSLYCVPSNTICATFSFSVDI